MRQSAIGDLNVTPDHRIAGLVTLMRILPGMVKKWSLQI